MTTMGEDNAHLPSFERGDRTRLRRPKSFLFKLTEEELATLKGLAQESAETVSQLLRRLIRREKRARANKRSLWSRKMRKVLAHSQRRALRDVLEETDWRAKLRKQIGEEGGFVIQVLEELFDDV